VEHSVMRINKLVFFVVNEYVNILDTFLIIDEEF
jgi:hypothetical protein